MINDKIGKLINKLDIATGMLIMPAMENKIVREAKEKINQVSFELGNLINEIEAEKAIDGCRVRRLAILEEIGDCGVDENGRCLGYEDEECRECIYCVNYGEE